MESLTACLKADIARPETLRVLQGVAARLAPSGEGTCVVIGNFDGVHLGHQALFAAAPPGLPLVALTFDPHPRELFGRPHLRLLSTPERVALLYDCGARLVVVVQFTYELAAMSPEVFVKDILHDTLHTRLLMLGHDFVLGHHRQGTASILSALGRSYDFSVLQVPALHDAQGRVISSTGIRDFLAHGHVEDAALQLGRPYHVCGTVVRGFQRGRLMNFPTANLSLPTPAPMLPAPGVYAATLLLPSSTQPHFSVTNIGRNPTFGQNPLTVESHLLDFSEDIYSQPLILRFHHHLRSEMKFDGMDALKTQIAADIDHARALFCLTS